MEQIYEKSITLPFRLLIRIHESMDFWEKEMRRNGYLNYLETIEV